MGLGHADRELAQPVALELLDLAPGVVVDVHVLRAVDPRRDRLDLLLRIGLVRLVEVAGTCSAARTASTTASARSTAPGPPCAKPSLSLGRGAPFSSREPSCTSLDLVVGVAGHPVDGHHAGHAELARRSRGGGFSAPVELAQPPRRRPSVAMPPPWCAARARSPRARRRSGRQPAHAADDVEELLHAHVRPEPGLGDEVVAELEADMSAISELLPCAMLANGPQCMKHGWPSSVWIRFGLSASLSSTAIAPGRAEVLGRDGLGRRRRSSATVIAPSRRRRSCRSRDTARIAITSEAAVMSKPVSRG